MLSWTNVLVAVLAWIAFRSIGLETAGARAVASGLRRVIPCPGPGVTAAAAGMPGFARFEFFATALLVCGTALAAAVAGIFVRTWVTGRIANMRSAAVFISLSFRAWFLGVPGMLLGSSTSVISKIVSEQVEHRRMEEDS